jgi:2-polyprenyl-3-methyl-5-hydroxy-6-metoxy-1,4-benzoquinol methylase
VSGQDAEFIQTTHVSSKSGTFDLVKCRQCGLIYLSPRPDAQEVRTLYDQSYFLKWYTDHQKRQSEKLYFQELFHRYGLRSDRTSNALDVGCGLGAFMEVAREWGWNAAGIERSEYAARYCREQLHFQVYEGTIAEADLPEQHFDVVTAFDVLEHVEGLAASLASVKKTLKPQGRLIVLVPNYEGLVFQLGRILHKIKKIPLPNTPEHLTYFTMTSLRRLLQTNGFSVKSMRSTDANVQADYLHCHGGLMALLRTVANYACYWIGIITTRREAILAVAERAND